MTDEKIIVQLKSPERKYVKVYHDFLDNYFLSVEEQMVFIALKSYIDFREDSGEVFPSVDTLCRRAKMSKPRTIKAINNLVKKGLVKKVRRGLTKKNLYTLADYPAMWACENAEDAAEIINNNGQKPLTPDEHIAALKRMGYKVQIKEKGLDNEPTKAHYQAPQINQFEQENNTIIFDESQYKERYTLAEIKEIFEYDVLKHDHPYYLPEAEAVMGVLHETLNSNKAKIRINGENKPALAVVRKLMQLNKESIAYAIEKYQEQTERIKNPRSYMLAILYNAPEQYILDTTNLVQHNTHN